jgi:hypothetical protein
VQADARHIEMNLAGLDLYRAGIDFLIETVRSQHRTPQEKMCIKAYGK